MKYNFIKTLTALITLTPISCLQLVSCSNGSYQLNFTVTEGGTITSTSSLTTQKTKWKNVAKPTYETKKGYIFKGWKYKSVFLDDEYEVSKNMDIVGVFTKTDAQSLYIDGSLYVWINKPQKYQAIIGPKGSPLTPKWSISIPEWSSANATIDQEGILNVITPGEVTINVELDDDYHTSASLTIEAVEDNALNKSIYQFYCDDWSEVVKYTSDFDTFKAHYTGITSKSDLIGIYKSIRINGRDHYARIIGVNHDELSDESGKTAFLTFEMQNEISKADGEELFCPWGETSESFAKSTINSNLNSEDDVIWYDSTGTRPVKEYNQSCLTMLQDKEKGEPALANAIKSVKKTIFEYDEEAEIKYSPTSHDFKLFVLSLVEMHPSVEGNYKKEGSGYEYWKNIEQEHLITRHRLFRIKGNANGATCPYWTRTPNIKSSTPNWAKFIDHKGTIVTEIATLVLGISFAFCI